MNATANVRTLAYGALGLPLAFAALPVYVHVPRYYAETVGIELALLGVILLCARLFDAGSDPVLGWLADRIPRRVMLAAALPLFAVGFVALLHPSRTQPQLWLLGSLLLTYLGYSAASIAHQAWGADLGADSVARTRLVAAREGFGLCGVVLAAMLPMLIAADFVRGVQWLGWLLPPLLLFAAIIAFAGTRTMPITRQAEQRHSLTRSLRGVLADSDFRRLLAVFMANGIASALPATLFMFFVADVLRAESVSGLLLALYFVSGAASLPLWVKLAARHGRVAAWLASMVLAMLAFAGAALLGPGDVAAFALICFASGLALGADLALPASIAADIGERMGRVGACFGVWNFVAKLNLALAAGVALPLIGALGYVPGNGEGLSALVFAYALLPLAFKSIAALLLWRWRHSLEIRT